MYLISIIIIVAMTIPLFAALVFMPYFTRETDSFGVSVSEETFRSEPLRKLRRQYAWISAVLYSLILIGCFLVSSSFPDVNKEVLITAGILAMVACSIGMSIKFHFIMKKMKASSLPSAPPKRQILALDTNFRRRKLILSNRWFLIHGVITAISTVWTLYYYDHIPQQLAMRFDFEGNVTQFADKSYVAVLFPNIMQILIILMFALINWSIVKSKQQIDASNPADSADRNAIFRRRWSFFNIMSGLIIVLLFSFIQLNMILKLNPDIIALVSLLMPALMVIWAMVLTFTTGQGGSRIRRQREASKAQPVDDDAHWKLGIIYFNSKDPSLFVEKRQGIGWTVNLGQPKIILIIFVPVAVIIAVSFLV